MRTNVFRTIATLVLLLVTTAVATVSLKDPQTLLSRAANEVTGAAVGDATPEPAAAGKEKLLSLEKAQGRQTLEVVQGRLRILYSPLLWKPQKELNPTDVVASTTLLLVGGNGRATVGIQTFAADTVKVTDERTLAAFVSRRALLSGSRVREEGATTVGGLAAVEFIMEESFAGAAIAFSQIAILDGNTLHLLVIRDDGLPESQAQVSRLIDTLSFLASEGQAPVLGATTEKPTTYEVVQLAELTKPSVVHILRVSCWRIKANDPSSLRFIRSQHKFCYWSKGTGFFVSSTGLVATNGHVVATYPEEAISKSFLFPELAKFASELVQEAASRTSGSILSTDSARSQLAAAAANPAAAGFLNQTLYQLLDTGKLAVSPDESKTYLSLSHEPFLYDDSLIAQGRAIDAIRRSPGIVTARVLSAAAPNYYAPAVVLRGERYTGTDVALLQVEESGNVSFPALPIGNSESYREGDTVVVLGYPEVAEGSVGGNSLVDYQTSSGTPSITRGVVSAIKKDTSGFRLIQTDASIDRGISGGPAVTSDGTVIGLATYAFGSGGGHFNFLRDIADLAALMDKKEIIRSPANETYKTWLVGLEYFWRDYFSRSAAAFAKVTKLYPLHPTASVYATDAAAAIKKSKDRGLILGVDRTVFIGAVVGAALMFILLWRIIVSLRTKAV